MIEFDLDAARAARTEAQREPKVFLFGGRKFELPVELPAEFSYILTDDTKEAFRFLLADDFDDFWGLRPSGDDLQALLAWLVGAYGASVGESSASGGPSDSSSGRSRPTSPPTTSSISAKRASAGRRRSGSDGSPR